MNFIKRSSSAFVLKTITLGYFGLIVCRNLSGFIIQKLESLEWCYSSVWRSSVFPSFRGEHGQAEARQLPLVQGNDGIADSRKTMPGVPPPPASGPVRRIKKSVSINENVEEIIPGKRRNRTIYGMANEDVKPLKSILKVGSRIRERQ